MVLEYVPDYHCMYLGLEWTVYQIFFFSIFLLKIFTQKRRRKKDDPSTNDFSYQKYINGSMATQREKTHIQYPNMYKLYVSINYIYTKKDSFLNLVVQPRREHSVTGGPPPVAQSAG